MVLARLAYIAVLGALVLGACSRPGTPGEAQGKVAPAPRDPLQPVQVVGVRRDVHTPSWVRPATLTARREVRVFTQEPGTLVTLPYYEGDKVEQGTLLARLDDRVLQAQLDKAQATRAQAELDLRRLQGLVRNKLVSEDEMARAATALQVARAEERLLQTRVGYTRVHAPFAGVVTARLVEPGDVVAVNTHILTLSDVSSLLAEVRVSELVLPALARDDPVQVSIDALDGRAFPARILRIHPSLDESTRLGTVEVVLEPVPEGARPGQLCRVTFRGPARTSLAIPLAAVQYDARGEYVFRIDGQGKARLTRITSGVAYDQLVEVRDGLQEGEQVVVKGLLGLRDGVAVDIVAGDAAAGAGTPPAERPALPRGS